MASAEKMQCVRLSGWLIRCLSKSLANVLTNSGVRPLIGVNEMNESQVYKQIVENLAQIDDDIARLRQQHLMLRVDIQILMEKREKTLLTSSK
jgi:hypothetical protein